MADSYIAPLVISKNGTEVDTDLSIALTFWSIENDRKNEKGGFLKAKNMEKVIQVSLLYRPILITNYGKATLAFDGCGVYSTKIKLGFAPSLTSLRRYFLSDDWAYKPELYAAGLEPHSELFEGACEGTQYELRGLLTGPILEEMGKLFNASKNSDLKINAFIQLLDFDRINELLVELEKIKSLLRTENLQLNTLKDMVVKKTTEVLNPLKMECAKIEKIYNDLREKQNDLTGLAKYSYILFGIDLIFALIIQRPFVFNIAVPFVGIVDLVDVLFIFSILFIIYLGYTLFALNQLITVNPSPQTQVYLTFNLKLTTMEYIGIVLAPLIALSIFRLLFSSERLLKHHKWFKKNQMKCYIVLDISLICLLVLTFYILSIYAT